jgi:hypothetical protein
MKLFFKLLLFSFISQQGWADSTAPIEDFHVTLHTLPSLPLKDLQEKKYQAVIPIFLNLIDAYLGGKAVDPGIIKVTQQKISVPAAIQCENFCTLIINEEAFQNSQQTFSQRQKLQALAIALFHELVHAWQFVNAPQDSEIHKLEGHAVLLGSIFSHDYGMDDINQQGIKALQSTQSIATIMNVNLVKAFIIKKKLEEEHWRGYQEVIAIYNEMKQSSAVQRLRDTTSRFLNVRPDSLEL